MSEIMDLVRDSMSALRMMPCRCEHNVPYAGCAVEQIVTRQCKRCEVLAKYDALQLRHPPTPDSGDAAGA